MNRVVEFPKSRRTVSRMLFCAKSDIIDVISYRKEDKLWDAIFNALIHKNEAEINEILENVNPDEITTVITSASFKISIGPHLSDKGNMQEYNVGLKNFYNNFIAKLSSKQKRS